MKKNLVMIALCVAMLGCSRQAQESAQVGDVKVEKLFTHDGCTAYRFYDGRTIHFVRCGGHVDTTWQRSCGKNCTRNERVATDEDYQQ